MECNIKEENTFEDDELQDKKCLLPAEVKVEIKEEEELCIDNNDEQNENIISTERKNDSEEDYGLLPNENEDEPSGSSGRQASHYSASEYVSYEIVEYDNFNTQNEHIDDNEMVVKNTNNSDTNCGTEDHMNVTPMNEWVVYRYMKMSCHLCGATFQHHVYKWLIHIKQQHPEIINKMETLYHMYCKNVAHCKICKQNVSPEFNHVYHFLNKHFSPVPPKPFVCTFCEYADSSFSSLQKHQGENHPLVSAKCEKCPKCRKPFRDAAVVEYHFMTAHASEFNTRCVCKCHLCNRFSTGSNKEEFFNHLMKEHKLDNWETLNFRKMENSPHLLCTKCFKIYINIDIHNLLNHFLSHDEKSSWTCKFCKCKNLFKDWPLPHLCRQMWQFFKEHTTTTSEYEDETNVEAVEDVNPTIVDKMEISTPANDETSSFISIMCTLCDNMPFPDLGKIITHFRSTHNCFDEYFEKATKERNRVCKICQTTMNRDKPSDIMIHYFKHLDERPFKCIKCLRSFTEYRTAQKHVKVFHLTDSIDIIGNMQKRMPPKEERERKTKKVVCPNNSNAFKVFEAYIVYACPECNKELPNLDSWEQHINEQHTFFQASNLNIVFFGNGKGKCTDCNTVISISMSLQKTHKLTHMQYTPYLCAICYERFSMINILYRHIRRVHLAKGSIKCPICPKELTTDCEKFDHLHKQHSRTEWPNNMCTKCYRIFNEVDSHRLTHEVILPKYHCECCGIYVAYHKDLEKHMQEMHGQVIERKKEKKKKKSSKRKSEDHSNDIKRLAVLPLVAGH